MESQISGQHLPSRRTVGACSNASDRLSFLQNGILSIWNPNQYNVLGHHYPGDIETPKGRKPIQLGATFKYPSGDGGVDVGQEGDVDFLEIRVLVLAVKNFGESLVGNVTA